MKFMLFALPSVPAETFDERKQLRPIGRNHDKYQQMIDELRKMAVFADQAGFDVMGTTEHHMHSEGMEASVAPMLLYTDLAARTERLKFAPLGLVLAAWDPIRVAEEVAVFDHLSKGRLYVGFARGYQDRWVNIMGQQYHSTGATMDGSAVDNHNRAVFEEAVKVIKKAWTEEAFHHDGEYYKVPYPYDTGITRWPITEFTNTYGAPGELDDNGAVRNVCIIPAPYQKPHPPMMQPFGASERTIFWCAKQGITPWILTAHPESFRHVAKVYQDSANAEGPQPQARPGPGRGALGALRQQRAGGGGPAGQNQFR